MEMMMLKKKKRKKGKVQVFWCLAFTTKIRRKYVVHTRTNYFISAQVAFYFILLLLFELLNTTLE